MSTLAVGQLRSQIKTAWRNFSVSRKGQVPYHTEGRTISVRSVLNQAKKYAKGISMGLDALLYNNLFHPNYGEVSYKLAMISINNGIRCRFICSYDFKSMLLFDGLKTLFV